MVATRLDSVRSVHRPVEGTRASELVLPDRPETSRKVRVDTERAIRHGRRLQGRAIGRAFGALGRWLAARGRRLTAGWRRAREESYAVRELRRLDDRMLRDIGIGHRSQITSAVHAMTAQTPVTSRTGGSQPAVPLEPRAREVESETTNKAA